MQKIKYPILIIVAVLLCYLPQAAKLSFVLSDDYIFLDLMASFLPAEDIKNFFIYLKKGIGWEENIPSPDFFTTLCCIGGFFRPVYYFYWFINFYLYGLNPSGYHLSILAIHVINALLVFYILSILTEHNALAMLTSLLFSLHPVHNEAILLLTAGAGVLATFFFLLSFLVYLRWLKSKSGLWCYVSSVIFFTLALMSYDSMFISALPILLVSSFLVKDKRWPQILLHFFPFMAMIGLVFLVRYNIMGTFTTLQTGYTLYFFKFPFQSGWSMLKQLLLLAPSAHANPDARSILELTVSSLTSLKVILVPFFLSLIITLAFTPTQPFSRGKFFSKNWIPASAGMTYNGCSMMSFLRKAALDLIRGIKKTIHIGNKKPTLVKKGWVGDLLHRAMHYPYLFLPFTKRVKSPLTPPFSKGGFGGIRALILAVTWVFVGALPFMIYGWGALPARYSYFCSVGWSLLMALFLLACAKKLKALFFILIFPTLLIFYGANSTEIMYWKEAGQVCKLILTKVKERLPNPPLGSKVFILNVPQTIDRALLAFDQTSSWTTGAMVSYRHMKDSVGFSQWRRNFFDRYGERDVAKAIMSYIFEKFSPLPHSLEFFLSFQKLAKRYIEAKGKEGEEEVLLWVYRFLPNPELNQVLDYNMLRERAKEIVHTSELASKTYLFKFDGKDLKSIDYLVSMTQWGKFRIVPIGLTYSKPFLIDDLSEFKEKDWVRIDSEYLILHQPPVITHEFNTDFNGEITFLGFDWFVDGNPYIKNLFISYYWKKMAELKGNYTVFVHFLDSQGRVVFQQDHPLGRSFSEKWKPGEIMVESYRVEIPKDIPKGRYSIRIGLWIPEKKEVMSVLKEGKAKKDIIGVIAGFLEL